MPQLGSANLATWQFTTGDDDADGRADLIVVNGRDGSSTAVHALSAASGFATYTAHSISALHATSSENWQFHGWSGRGGGGGGGGSDVTLSELQAIFGTLGDPAAIQAGLPSLNTEMQRADITTPARKAAFLATLRHESGFRYNATEAGNPSPYRGRGFIQLTGDFNYRAAGNDLGHDFVNNPDDAATLAWSAPIARWYWTIARDINPMADRLDMGAVNVAIGYAPSPAEDAARCDDFKAALRYYNGGTLPGGIDCER